MATKLKKMRLTSVDLVRAGANQEADICLYKSADPAEPTEKPTEEEKNIFKRFLNWLHEDAAEAENEPVEGIEKADEPEYPADIYKSAITESIQSIVADDRLSLDEKNAMIEKSISQYHDSMAGLFAMEEELEKSEREEFLFEDLEKSDRYDDIEEI